MKLIPDKFIQPKREPYKTRHRVEILGAVLVVVLAISAFVLYGAGSRGVPTDGAANSSVSGTQKKSIGPISTQSSTTATTSTAEKQKLVTTMSKQSSTTGAVASPSPTTAPVSNVSAAEKQKLFDAMQQKAQ